MKLDLVFKGFKAIYTDAYLQALTYKDKIAMTVPSVGREETYGWLGPFPPLREWIGPRHVHSLQAHGFTITNRKFESTVSVKRDDISDDKLGTFKPSFSEMGTCRAITLRNSFLGCWRQDLPRAATTAALSSRKITSKKTRMARASPSATCRMVPIRPGISWTRPVRSSL